MAEIARCWTCESDPYRNGASGCKWTSTAQGARPAGCQSWWKCFRNCDPRGGFWGKTQLNTTTTQSPQKTEYVREISQYPNPTITLSFATDDPYTTNCAYSGDDVTFSARAFTNPPRLHTENDSNLALGDTSYGSLTHTFDATITTGYLYIIKKPYLTDYLLLDDREALSTADLDKTLELGDDETVKSGTVTVAESASKKVITFTSTIQIERVGKEDTVYEFDIDSVITNIPQAFEQEVSTPKETAITINVLNGVKTATYLVPAITLPPKHGTLVTSSFAAGVGTCVYTPPTLFQGKDEFTFEVADGTNTSEDKYTVTINVGNVACK